MIYDIYMYFIHDIAHTCIHVHVHVYVLYHKLCISALSLLSELGAVGSNQISLYNLI